MRVRHNNKGIAARPWLDARTGLKDGEWLRTCCAHGLLRKSFLPDKPIRELRDLTRNRAMLAKERARLSCRIQKGVEDANIKLASGATHVVGASRAGNAEGD
jgi:hypothetical protein